MSRLVHVSSPSVAHAGPTPWSASAPNRPTPTRARGAYARTKAVAERLALAAHGDGLAVVAIRPHLVWGPGDAQLIDRVVARARAGRLLLVGSGAALVDTTYVDNAADALVAALDRCCRDRRAGPGGDQRRAAADRRAVRPDLCGGRGARPAPPGAERPWRTRRVAVNEAIWAVRDRIRPVAGDPPLTRFLIEQMSTAHWFDQRRTRAALGWSPRSQPRPGLRHPRRVLPTLRQIRISDRARDSAGAAARARPAPRSGRDRAAPTPWRSRSRSTSFTVGRVVPDIRPSSSWVTVIGAPPNSSASTSSRRMTRSWVGTKSISSRCSGQPGRPGRRATPPGTGRSAGQRPGAPRTGCDAARWSRKPRSAVIVAVRRAFGSIKASSPKTLPGPSTARIAWSPCGVSTRTATRPRSSRWKRVGRVTLVEQGLAPGEVSPPAGPQHPLAVGRRKAGQTGHSVTLAQLAGGRDLVRPALPDRLEIGTGAACSSLPLDPAVRMDASMTDDGRAGAAS